MAHRGTFAFELSKPTKKGTLMKQGALHKAFKYRYFVLYPGFLVYYDSENKWRVDLAKGETLGNRIGAIKLKNGTVNVARDAPKGCKFGLIVHAPDPVNKRQSYLLNALNKGDRDDWISAVKKAIPTPKNKKAVQPEPVSRPPPVVRQHTADAAALLDSADVEEENDVVSSAPFIEKRGFLYKEGGQRKTWKLRYFVLQPGMFTYYKNNASAKPLGEVKLKNLHVRYPSASERKQSFQFTIHTESSWNKRSDYVIAAQSDAELKDWIAAFKLAGQKNTTPTTSPPGSSDDETTPTS